MNKIKEVNKKLYLNEGDNRDDIDIKIVVFVNQLVDENVPSGNKQDKYDKETVQEWYDFADSIEDYINSVGEVVSATESKHSLSQYIDFYVIDSNNNTVDGLIDLRLSDHSQTNTVKRVRRKHAERIDPNYDLLTITVNGKKFNNYESAFEYVKSKIDEVRNNKLGLKEDIEKHDELNPAIFENGEMKPEVKEVLEKVVDKFLDQLAWDGVELDVKDVVVVGSNASYNYTKHSDIDLHIIADLSMYDDYEDLAEKFLNAKKTIFNNTYDPMIKGYEIEVYVEPADDVDNNDVPDAVESLNV